MKFYKVLALGMVASMAFTACDSDNDDYTFADKPEGAQVYFPTQNPASYRLVMADEPQTLNVEISRASTTDAATVSITSSAPEGVTVPSSVSFSAGQATTSVPVVYDPQVIGYDNPFAVSMAIGDQSATTPYGYSSYSFKAIIPSPWTSLGECTYVEQFVGIWFGVDNISYPVEIQENDLQPGYYRLVYPYDGKYGYNDTGDWDTSKDYYLEIHAENPEKVYIDKQQIGIDWGYGMFSIWSLASYYMAKGDLASAEPYYGTLTDGVISFPADALLCSLANYNNGGFSQGGAGGPMVVLPGYVLADYSIELSYNGKLYDAEDNLYIVAAADFGSDVEEVRLAVAPAKEADAMADAIIDGTFTDFVSLSAPGSCQIPMDPNAESGKYAIVAVSYAGGEAQETSKATFKYTSLNGEPVETWTDYYVGYWLFNFLFEEPAAQQNLILSLSDADPKQERCRIAPWLDNEDGITFTWPENDALVLDNEQETGDGTWFAADMTSPCALVGGAATWYEVITSQLSDYCNGSESTPGSADWETYTLTFNLVYYTEGGNLAWGLDNFTLTGNAESAPRKAASRAFEIPTRKNVIDGRKIFKYAPKNAPKSVF